MKPRHSESSSNYYSCAYDFKSDFLVANSLIGARRPSYFIADVAANHDGSLDKAIELINLCAESGADAVKFQHFTASTIVSDYGFRALGSQQSHQSSWKKSVYEVYDAAALDMDWTPILKKECDKVGVDFFTSPYSIDLVDKVDPYVPAYKIGSGDITWLEIIEHISLKGKPVMLATGASTLDDVERAMAVIAKHCQEVVLMQCNTNYTVNPENFNHIHLNVLKTYAAMYPSVVLGLSDHTPGHATVLGAIALGARVIEKHFTIDNSLEGPDHTFSMNPITWKEMVDRSRELEMALGCGVKKVESNELETVVLQRRGVCYKGDFPAGHVLKKEDLEVLRPCPDEAVRPYDIDKILGRSLLLDVNKGESARWIDIR